MIGRLESKVEIKNLDGDKTLGKVFIVTNGYYKNQKSERVEETTRHNLVNLGKQAEPLDKYTEKGLAIAIEGKISKRSYEDKKGNKRYISEVVVQNILQMGELKAAVPAGASEEDDLPFYPLEFKTKLKSEPTIAHTLMLKLRTPEQPRMRIVKQSLNLTVQKTKM
ncbi:single-stranded DNA-binding protein [Algoriphagus halophytocola]|uniref:Single-stranded DNA-binding protein n=1 Tax=Algoriphagus halophytocola TaxID=2991499 RepID=A0ABY6MQ28_9BACT|nr:single-stranded DNA-binding protein [Algoriphagus sp. TR-M5]UZD24731.1 single-stranded DNA-binding protein [Algoriphagus sp. TR-M5]